MTLKNLSSYMKYLLLSGGPYYEGETVITVPENDALKSTSGTSFTNLAISTDDSSIYNNPGKPFAYMNYSSLTTAQTSLPTGSKSTTYVICGTGTTAVTENDYRLESPITSGLSLASTNTFFTQTYELSEDGNSLVRTCKFSMSPRNTSSADITITEIGFFQHIFYKKGYAYSTMLHRIVLDEPVTIQAGAIGTLQFEFTFTTTIA